MDLPNLYLFLQKSSLGRINCPFSSFVFLSFLILCSLYTSTFFSQFCLPMSAHQPPLKNNSLTCFDNKLSHSPTGPHMSHCRRPSVYCITPKSFLEQKKWISKLYGVLFKFIPPGSSLIALLG